jgi:hypothetical protein
MLTEQSIIDVINVLSQGQLEIRRADLVLRDGVEITRTYHRHCLKPGDELGNENERVVAVANAVWTPAVIEAYQNSIANATLPLSPEAV